MTISCLSVEIKILFYPEWKETGLKVEESFIMKIKLLLFGLMKKINLESSLCNKEEMLTKFSKDCLNLLDKLKLVFKLKEKNSQFTNNMVSYLLAHQI